MTAEKTETTPKIAFPFDSLMLRAIVGDLRPRLAGGQIQDIRQPEPMELRLAIRSQGKTHLLLLSADARFARVHLTDAKAPNAPTPPAFCALLRKYLEGGSAREVRQRDFDRVFEMEIEARNADGESARFTLIAELMGKHSNLVLVNAEGMVLDAAKRITHRVNRYRETLPGKPYVPPPTQPDRLDPFAPDALSAFLATAPPSETAALSESLLRAFGGLSPFLAQEIAARAAQEGEDLQAGLKRAWNELFGAASRSEFAPVRVTVDSWRGGVLPFPTVQVPAPLQQRVPDLNAALDSHYRATRENEETLALFNGLRSRIEREIRWHSGQQQAAERAIEEAHRADAHQQAGELLLANLHRVEPGSASVAVPDYYAPEPAERIIPLDPKLSPQENAEACFRRARRARDNQERALEQGGKSEEALERLEAEKSRLHALMVEGIGAPQLLREREAELVARGLLPKEKRAEEGEAGERAGPDFQGHKIRRVATPEGYELFYGESATANDFLTTKIAAPSDLWLHVRAATGAHVVIRANGRPDAVPRSVIEQAAHLAARNSAQKHSSLVAVDVTQRKFVRKPRKSAPGCVLYQQEKTLHVTP